MELLSGYKTYAAAALLFVGAVGAYVAGDNNRALELFGVALGLAGLRSAMNSK